MTKRTSSMIHIIQKKTWFTLLAGLGLAFNVYASGNTLHCASSKKLVCLGYGDKVVGDNAVCFDRFECSQEGFVCKSELDGMAAEHEQLLGKHNELVNTYNELLSAHESTVTGYERFERCVSVASTLEDAKTCDRGS